MSDAVDPAVCSVMISGAAQGTDIATRSSSMLKKRAEATPKSESTGDPVGVLRMFDGLISRCKIPARCTVSNAPAIRTETSSTSPTDRRYSRYAVAYESGQYSITKYGLPSVALLA